VSHRPVSYGPRPWQQTNWDWRAAANFMFGGTGAGLMIALALVQNQSPYPVILALLLVAGGLGAVWLEIGRKLRAIHVFFNPQTSWMTRESLVALILFGFGISYLAIDDSWLQYAAALAALAFVYCQARILRAAKGIPAWRAPQVVALIMTTALVEGTGLLMFVNSDLLATSLITTAVIARAVAWSGYWSALKQPGSRAALEPAGKILMQLGTLAPLALLLGAYYVPVAAPLAGLVAIAAGWRFKYVLVTRAALNQGFALPQLPVRGVR
jgi:phenylacetyl-CoA:acceptor oxidoreductase 26-kDa subunit